MRVRRSAQRQQGASWLRTPCCQNQNSLLSEGTIARLHLSFPLCLPFFLLCRLTQNRFCRRLK